MSDLRPGITALIACHPIRMRNGYLVRAVKSACAQTLQPDAIVIVNDVAKKGAGWTRREALSQVRTTRFAWLDSDDYWYPWHLKKLNDLMDETKAKYAFSYFDGQGDPFASTESPQGHFGREFDVHNPHHTTITAMIDTELALEVGYGDSDLDGKYSNEDWPFIVRFAQLCAERGYSMVHLPEKTWYYEQNPGMNSSGLPTQGDAALSF